MEGLFYQEKLHYTRMRRRRHQRETASPRCGTWFVWSFMFSWLLRPLHMSQMLFYHRPDPMLVFWVFLFVCLFYFILLYKTILILPYIDMNPPWVYTSSQSCVNVHPVPLSRNILHYFILSLPFTFLRFQMADWKHFPVNMNPLQSHANYK